MSRLLAALVVLSLAQQASARGRAELDERAAAAREAIERIAREESSVGEELERAERALREAERARDETEEALQAARVALSQAHLAELEAREAVALRQKELAPRLKARYRLLRRGTVGALLLAPSPAALVRLQRAFDRLLEADLELLRGLREQSEALEEARRLAAEAEAEVAAMAEALEAQLLQANERAEERKALLASLREEKKLQRQVLAEVRRARARLDAELRRLRKEREAMATGFGAKKGKLPRPVEGAVVEVPFGKIVNARFKTVTQQNGLDLRIHEGAPVRAVAEGKVVFAGPFRGYGNLVIVDHGNGFHSLYAHLQTIGIAEGEKVEEGTLVGLVGDTGSLKGAYLYFEIRRDGRPIDPMPWFRRE